MGSERIRAEGRLYNQTPETKVDEDIETPQISYCRDTSQNDIQELPPAWEPEPSVWTVGYEPVGATSIGVEQERRSHSRRRGLRVKTTKLSDHNEGRHPSDGTQGKRLAGIDKKRITQALCSRLGIGGLQQEEAVRAILMLDLRRFGAHKKITRVALAVICVVVDYHQRYKRRSPDVERLGSDPVFKMLSHEVGLADVHIQVSRKVKEELKRLTFFEPSAPGLETYNKALYSAGTFGASAGKPLFLLQSLID